LVPVLASGCLLLDAAAPELGATYQSDISF
jgi:hypothetical protein